MSERVVRWERRFEFVATQRPGEVVKQLHRPPSPTPAPGATAPPVPIHKADPAPAAGGVQPMNTRDRAAALLEQLEDIHVRHADVLQALNPKWPQGKALVQALSDNPNLQAQMIEALNLAAITRR